MRNVKRDVAEFGNHKANGGIRVVVNIGDEGSLKGHARTINYTVGGTAERGEGKDYTIDKCCSVTLPANRHSAVINIYVNDDGLDEGDENIVLTLQDQDGAGYTVNDAKKKTTVTIADDDTRGLTFYRKWPDVQEGGSGKLTVKLASQPTEPVEVSIVSNNPDVTTTPTSLLFNPTAAIRWDTAQTVTVHAAHDSDAVNDEAILTYTTSGGDYGGVNALSIERPVSVDDDETADPITSNLPQISIDGGSDVTEGSPASFTVNADPAPTSSLTVNVEVIEPPGQDFVAASAEGVRTVTLNAGATSATFTVPTVNDSTDEADGVVQVNVNDGTGYIADQGAAAVNVNDNDGTGPPTTPAASFAAASSSAAESAGTRNVTVNLSSAAPSGGLTLNYSVSGTATAGSGNDFTIQNSGTLTIAVGANTATIPVAINDDSATESAETVILTLTGGGGTGYTVGSPSVHTLTITDNDSTSAQPSVSFNSASSSAAESAGTRNVTVTISPAPSSGFTLSYGVSGTAAAGSDFTILNSGTLGVAAGETSAIIPVAITDDDTDERDETVILTLTGGTGYTLGGTTVHTLTITDNDDQPGTPALQLPSNTLSVSEGGTGSYALRLSSQPTAAVTVNIASGNPDVTVSPTSLTFNPSGSKLWSTPQTVTVSAAEDVDTINDSATLTHTASGGDYGSVTGSVTVTVNDDDVLLVSFDSPTSSVEEVDSTHLVQVDLSLVAPMGGLTLGYRVTGTATPGSDFSIQKSGTLTVTAGAKTATIPVVISDDSTPENTETVILTLTGGAGYTLGSTTVHTLTITNDDGHEVSFTAAEDRIPEGREHTVAVRIFPVSDNLTNVISYTISGTATAEEDFEDLPVMVEVPAGESQAVIRIETIADKEDDSGETVVLTLDQPTDQGLALGSPSVHTLTIVDSKEAIVEAGRSWLVRFGRSVAEQLSTVLASDCGRRVPKAPRSVWLEHRCPLVSRGLSVHLSLRQPIVLSMILTRTARPLHQVLHKPCLNER